MMNSYIWFIVLSVLVASFSQILLKKSATKEYPNRIREYLNPYVITGYGMMVVSTVLTVIAYTRVDFKNGPIIVLQGKDNDKKVHRNGPDHYRDRHLLYLIRQICSVTAQAEALFFVAREHK